MIPKAKALLACLATYIPGFNTVRTTGGTDSARYYYSVWLRDLMLAHAALDLVRYSDLSRTRAVLDELVRLFQERAPIPDESEFPSLNPRLANYAFPRDVLPTRSLGPGMPPGPFESTNRASLGR